MFENGQVVLDGTLDLASLDALSNSGGFLFGERIDVVNISGNFKSPRNTAAHATVGVQVLGETVYNLDENGTPQWSKTDNVSRPFDVSTTVPFTLGPIPVSLTCGVQGRAGVQYFVGLQPVAIKANIGPSVGSNGYCRLAVDVLVFEVGVKGTLTFLSDTLVLNSDFALQWNGLAHLPFYAEKVSLDDTLSTLSGRLDVFFKLDLGFWDNTWSWTIWDWSGFSISGSLFDVSQTDYFVPPPWVKAKLPSNVIRD